MVKQVSVTLIHHYKIVLEFIQTEDIDLIYSKMFIYLYLTLHRQIVSSGYAKHAKN